MKNPAVSLRSLLATGVFLAAAAPLLPGQVQAEYFTLDRVEGEHLLTNTAPIRPMDFDAGGRLWAVNTHANTVERFSPPAPGQTEVGADRVLDVPWGPVALDVWQNPSAGQELLVVCRDSRSLLRMQLNGTYLDLLRLPGEPGDLLVDEENGRAFVSCMATDCVVQVDLSADPMAIEYEYRLTDRDTNAPVEPAFALKSPLFLSFDPVVEGAVLVAPLHSGNATTAMGTDGNSEATGGVVPFPEAPDEDLFRLRPDAPAGARVEVVATGLGTLLFAHGANPAAEEIWLLNTEAKNLSAQTEAGLRGDFVENRLTVLSYDPTWTTLQGVASDEFDAFTQGERLGQPVALTFNPNADGTAFVCGLLTDNVARIGWNPAAPGQEIQLLEEWDLPDGSIPRGMLVNAKWILTYCWGTNEVLMQRWDVADPTTTTRRLLLTPDPTPSRMQDGRRIFFDGANSEKQNASCASCHFDAGTDFLVWNLESEKDEKGPLVTQSLVGLERLAPFHWRGERELEDFNGAFVGLLGAAQELSSEDFQLMGEYLFALRTPANPFQDEDRVLSPSKHFSAETADVGDARIGQDFWFNQEFNLFGLRFVCGDCHPQPTGTNNDLATTPPQALPNERSHLKNTPLAAVWRKVQPSAGSGTGRRALLGAGVSHAGLVADVLDFTAGALPGATEEQVDGVVDFMTQWDTGIAPAAHYAFLLDADSEASGAAAGMQGYLMPQLVARNCDLVVMGASHDGSALRPMRWSWDRDVALFVPEDPSAFPPRELVHFRQGTAQGEWNLFVGLPVGMGESFGIDFDGDGVPNGSDGVDGATERDPTQPGGDPLPGSPIVEPGSLVVDWVSTRAARLRFETNEPTTATVTLLEPGTLAQRTFRADEPSKTHSLILDGLRASTPDLSPPFAVEIQDESVTYGGGIELARVRVEDLVANPGSEPIPAFTTADFTNPHVATTDPEDARRILHEHFIQDFQLTVTDELEPSGFGGGLHFARGVATLGLAHKQGALVAGEKQPAPRRLVLARVFRKEPGSEPVPVGFTPRSGSLRVDAVELGAGGPGPGPVGPYLVNRILTAGDGEAVLSFDLNPGAVLPGDEVQVNVEAVVEIPPAELSAMQADLNAYSGGTLLLRANPIGAGGNARAYSGWDFPTSKEARTCVGAVYSL